MFNRLVGLTVTNDEGYERYRTLMRPILENYGGFFRYDFKVSQVLKTEAEHVINRVFIISFPDREKSDKFFADERYLEIRKEFFVPSVSGATTIAQYLH